MDTETQPREFLTRVEIAAFLTEQGFPTPKGTLQKLACVGGGPPYYLYGNKALYRPAECLEWAHARLSRRMKQTQAA